MPRRNLSAPYVEVFTSLRQILGLYPDKKAAEALWYLILRLYCLEEVRRAAKELIEWQGVNDSVLRANLDEALKLMKRVRRRI